MRKTYSIISLFCASTLMFAQQKAVKHQHDHEISYEQAIAKAHKITGFESKSQVFSEIEKRIVLDKSKSIDFIKHIEPIVTEDIQFGIRGIGKGEITKQNLSNYYGDFLEKYKLMYEDFVNNGNKKVFLGDNQILPFGPGQPCQNGDFETQTTAGWEGSWGQGGSPMDPTMNIGFNNPGINSNTGQHVIVTSGNDPNIAAIPRVYPGGTASIRVGDDSNGGNRSSLLKQTFQVDPAFPYFIYHYAVVLEDPGHPVYNQPFFKVRMTDAVGNEISCAGLNVDATNSTGLLTSGNFKYKNWSDVLVPLTAYAGQDVTIYFITGDCNDSHSSNGGAHDGYAYIDAQCTFTPTIVASQPILCNGQSLTLTGPSGLGQYAWTGPGIVSGGNAQVVTVNQPGTYNLSLTTQTSPPNTPCTFTMTYVVPGQNNAAQFASNTVCVGTPTQLTDASAAGGSITSWAWDFDNNGTTDATTQNPTHTFPAAGTYPVTLTITVGSCTATVTTNVIVNAGGTPTITAVPAICADSASFALVPSTAGGTWSATCGTCIDPNTGVFNPSLANASNTITYTLTGACAGVGTTTITVNPVANPAWTQPTAMCATDAPINLNTFITGTAGGTFSGTGVTGNSFNPSGLNGVYTITYTVGSSPCIATQTQNIAVFNNPDATITAVNPLCSNASSITLTAASGGGTWSGTGITNPSTGAFDPSTATPGINVITYAIPGTCGDTDTVHVLVIPSGNPAFTLPASICASANSLDLNTLVTGTAGGTWSGNGVSGNTFNPNGLSGNVTITYTVGQGVCAQTSSQTIFVSEIDAAFTATPTTGTAPLNVVFTDGSTGAITYNWNFGDGNTSTFVNPTNTYNSAGNYNAVLVVSNASGCVDSVSILIVVLDVVEPSVLVIPNVFTPNGDGNNDNFMPVMAEGIVSFKAVVYDRWGLKMYEWTNADSNGWNGSAKNGSPAPDGAYYYIITAKGADNKEYNTTGYIQLIRK
ncbi:MAG: gliding motility-associated C-terminal domain-containing protein [Bacteroidia bacterium]|nr:gliding motility-associated C-terminal domain-containing protein [Bacteroidia bacterium]